MSRVKVLTRPSLTSHVFENHSSLADDPSSSMSCFCENSAFESCVQPCIVAQGTDKKLLMNRMTDSTLGRILRVHTARHLQDSYCNRELSDTAITFRETNYILSFQ